MRRFRHDVYDCLQRAKDALFNMVDALITEDRAQSFPELSLSPHFQRKWPSLYEAMEDGRIDQKRLQEVFIRYLPRAAATDYLWLGIDASSIARPCAKTSADRSAQYVHNLPDCKKPVTFGWQFSTLVALSGEPSSWTFLLDQQRIPSETTAVQVAQAQMSRCAPLLPKKTVLLLDRGYNSTWLWCQLSQLAITGTLIRLKCNVNFYRVAPPLTKKQGAPCKDGKKLQPKDPCTQGNPDGQWAGNDQKGRPVEVTWWKQLHVKQARWLEVTVMRVLRPHATNTERDPRVSWFVWIGDQEVDLAQIALGYALRFGQEHGYRFDKQALLWDKPRLRTPEQFERWSQVVAIAHNHLGLARDLVAPELHPWENKHRVPSPQQVRRGLSKLLPQLGTPAQAPQPRGKPKGRIKGAKIHKAQRHPVVRKKATLPQIVPS
jgi:hypothetical protein